MKKLVLIASIAALFASCSTDDLNSELSENHVEMLSSKSSDLHSFYINEPMPVDNCFGSPEAQVSVNFLEGLGGLADLVFFASTQGAEPGYDAVVSLQVETLLDCEDMILGTGEISTFYVGTYNNLDMAMPTITLKQNVLPVNCYRWRFIFDRKTKSKFDLNCSTVTQWYEEPLF